MLSATLLISTWRAQILSIHLILNIRYPLILIPTILFTGALAIIPAGVTFACLAAMFFFMLAWWFASAVIGITWGILQAFFLPVFPFYFTYNYYQIGQKASLCFRS